MHLHIGHMFFGAGNFGDDLVMAGFLTGIAGATPGLKMTCATPFDIDAQRRRFPQVEWSVYTPATREALIAACDVWLGLGGAVLQQIDDSWLLADQMVQLEACRQRGKPVFFLGCGIDYRADARRPEIRLLLDSARWIWTRDALSTTALERMGFSRATSAADLSHLVLRALPPARLEPHSSGFVCNFELAAHYSVEALTNLIAATAAAARAVPWLVQEVRALPGSELDIYRRLSAATRSLIELRQPEYGAASTTELIGSWGRPARLFSSRFHGAIVGAWSGSRVVVFERHQKLRGIAKDLGIISLSSMPDSRKLALAFERAEPVAQSVLDATADQAQRACTAFLTAAAETISASPANSSRPSRDDSMITMSRPRAERHSLAGVTEVRLDRVGPGLRRGEIFVVRNCLQAIGALEPLRSMILDTLEEVAGPIARAKAVARGLSRLHEFVPIDQLMQMNPLMKQRSRRLAARIVADLAASLLELGPDVHFEDTPNVRIFIPHDVSAQHEAALKTYVRQRGSGGELTLHPPHQDSRHFHPQGAINVWCAIDQVVERNGMSIFPEFYGHHLPFTQADGGIRPDQYLGRPVTMDLDPGDALIFETIHVHGSTINQTDQTRFVISFRLTTDVPEFRSKPWYNYVRPAACSAEGPPPNPVDYGQAPPDRGPITIDTGGKLPAMVASSQRADGVIEIPGGVVPEGEIRPVSDELCIARIGGKPIAFFRRCPHEGADLAGGAVRNGHIVCAWHGLRINATDGRSGCRSLGALELVPCEDRNGVIIIGRSPAPRENGAPIAARDEHATAIEHFIAAADHFRTLLTDRQAPEQWGLEQLRSARDAAVYTLLGLPGSVIRDRLEAPVGSLLAAVLVSGVRRLARTAEEEAAFVECWRRLGKYWDADAGFSYGLAALALSRHGYELIALQPLTHDLGWAEPFWLQCLLETLPGFLRPGDPNRFADTLPPLLAQVQDRIDRMTADARALLFKAFLATSISIQGHISERNLETDWLARDGEIRTLTNFLKEANADRAACHEQINTLTNFLKEANADRAVCHEQINTLTSFLKEANADRAVCHEQISTLTNSLKEANADRAACHERIKILSAARLSPALYRVLAQGLRGLRGLRG